MNVYLSLLRGVNVGSHGRIKMQDLVELYQSLGFSEVHTVLQSGNVVFASRLKDRVLMARRIHQELQRRLDLTVDVVLRTLTEVELIVERTPRPGSQSDPSKLLVMFLTHVPQAEYQSELLRKHKGEEMLEPRGPEVYLYYPHGIARSKLTTAVIESVLRVSGTARNWNTLTRLLEVAREIAGRVSA